MLREGFADLGEGVFMVGDGISLFGNAVALRMILHAGSGEVHFSGSNQS